jgi:hypothetical protein
MGESICLSDSCNQREENHQQDWLLNKEEHFGIPPTYWKEKQKNKKKHEKSSNDPLTQLIKWENDWRTVTAENFNCKQY